MHHLYYIVLVYVGMIQLSIHILYKNLEISKTKSYLKLKLIGENFNYWINTW